MTTVKDLNLFDLLQNNALGVVALHSFILGYTKVKIGQENDEKIEPSIDYLFYVLPIVYGESSLKSFKSSFELYTAIAKDKSISLGLQERAEKMKEQTLECLNLGFSKQIFFINIEEYTVGLNENYNSSNLLSSMKFSNSYYKDVYRASYRLGNIFAKKDNKMLQLKLNIRF